MDALPALRLVADLTPFQDAPDGVLCWSGHLRDNPALRVTLLLQDEPVEALDASFVDRICAGSDPLLVKAAQAAGLDGDPARWDPELTFRSGHAWEVRFTEAPGPTELGLLVVFDDEEVTEVDDLSEWDY